MHGIYTALVTPVKNGAVDIPTLSKIVRFVIDNGSTGLVVLGGTGEYTALSQKERTEAVQTCIESAKGEVPVVVGILAPGLKDAVKMGKRSRELGADAVMVVTPYYVIPSQEGIKDYYRRFLDAIDLPLILYNIPYRTNVNMLPETVDAIVKEAGKRILGIKECTPNLGQVSRLLQLVGEKIAFICGEEPLMFPELVMGAKGAILATSNVIPKLWTTMYDRVQSGDLEGARELHFQVGLFLKLVFAETNPGPLKEAMKAAGFNCGSALSPLLPPNEGLKSALLSELKRLQSWIDMNL